MVQDKKRNLLAGVVGPAKRRVVPVVGGDDDEVVRLHDFEKIAEPAIEFRQRLRVTGHVAPMAEEHVEIDQIREEQAVFHFRPKLARCIPCLRRSKRSGCDSVMPSPAKMSAIFPTPMTSDAAFAERVENAARRLHGVIVPPRGAPEMSRRAIERPRDDAPDAGGVRVAARDFANLVKPLDRQHVFVRGDLQNGIGGGVEDRFAGAHVFRAEFFENGGAAARVVADEIRRRLRARSRAPARRESCSKTAKGSSRMMPASSQWPVVVSLPAERSCIRP